jgi:hypothetical protein
MRFLHGLWTCRSAMSWWWVVQRRVRRQCGVLSGIPVKINSGLFLVSRAWMTRVSSPREPQEACIGSPEPP